MNLQFDCILLLECVFQLDLKNFGGVIGLLRTQREAQHVSLSSRLALAPYGRRRKNTHRGVPPANEPTVTAHPRRRIAPISRGQPLLP